MKAFWKKKKKLENELTLEEMTESFNVFVFEAQRLRSRQVDEALERDKKRRPQDYVR